MSNETPSTTPELGIPCTDTWPPGTWTWPVQDAYRKLEEAGGIIVDKIRIGSSTHYVTITYRAAYPQEWVHQILANLSRGTR